MQSNRKFVKPSDQEIAEHEACGHCPCRDGIVLVLMARGGETLTNDSERNRTVFLWQAWVLHRWTGTNVER